MICCLDVVLLKFYSKLLFFSMHAMRPAHHIRLDLISLIINVSRGSSVSVVSGYGLDNRAIEVRSLAEARGRCGTALVNNI
jgi:hypothetical protein